MRSQHEQNPVSQDKLLAKPVLEVADQPCYPTRSGRWGKTASGAATFFLAISTGGCVDSQAVAEDVNPPVAVQQVERASGDDIPPKTEQQNQGAIVAPIFEHGEGRGSTGCMAVSPPAFLSEDDAMQIIKEELGKHGIKLGKGGELEGVEVRMLVPNIYRFEEDEGKKLEMPMTLNVDAKGKDTDIVVEFVSKSDLDALRDEDLRQERERRERLLKERLSEEHWLRDRLMLELELSSVSRSWSSSSSYNTKEIAEYLAKEAQGKGGQKVYLGVFYDPVERVGLFADPKEAEKMVARMKAMMEGREISEDKEATKKEIKLLTREERQKKAENESKKQLRKQVRDFAGWLEKQGVELSAEKKD